MHNQRNSTHIRENAIKMAIKKAQAGCQSCAAGYVELAKQHGATKEQLHNAIATASSSFEQGMSRRSLLKLIAGTSVGLTFGTLGLSGKAWADSSDYWGTDTNTVSETIYGLPQDFYIGRLGHDTTLDTSAFNVNTATATGYNSTYAFWDIEGPDYQPSMSAFSWGYQQGQTAAYQQFHSNIGTTYVGGNTVFGDIEKGNFGWRTTGNPADKSANQAVLEGFLAAVSNQTFGPTVPGVYISPYIWQLFFGGDYITNTDFVLWMTGYQTSAISCWPCASCTDTQTQVEAMLPSVQQQSLGGAGVVVWQYWISGSGCGGDFDVAIQNPSIGFSPLRVV